jgi:putative tryptophan/tyrosine transport system substrate-binding protein
LESSLGGKWLGLLSEITPALKRVAIMFNADTTPASRVYMPSVETAARALKIAAITESVHSDVEIETAIIALGRGLVVIPDFDQVPSGGQSQDCEGARPEVPSSILLRADEVIE